MIKVLTQFERLTLDQKIYLAVALLSLGLVFVYALSRVSERPKVVVEESKSEDFKNGNLTTDETPDFYRRKDEMQQRQNDAILTAQKSLEEKVSELGKRLDEGKGTAPTATAETIVPSTGVPAVPDPVTGENGKKLIRRGQNQSKMNFLLDTRATA